MRRRFVLTVATWAAVANLVVGSANAQSPTPPGDGLVLVGVVMREGERGLAWVQASFTDNKVVIVRLGDTVGPYRVAKILSHRVDLVGPDGTISVPLAGLPGAVAVASTTGTGGSSAGETLPPPDTSITTNIIPGEVIPPGDPRGRFPSRYLEAGTRFIDSGSFGLPPETSEPRPASVQAVAAATVMPASRPPIVPGEVIPPGDPRQLFPAARYLIGAR